MAAVDLIFKRAFKTGNPVELVFGDDGGGGQVPDATLVVAARMPGLRVRSLVHVRKDLVAAGRMPGLRCSAVVRYNTDTPRPVVAEVAASASRRSLWQQGWARAGKTRMHCLRAGWRPRRTPCPCKSSSALPGRTASGRGGPAGAVSAGAGAAWCSNAGPLARGPGRARGPAGHGPGCRARAGRLGRAVSGKPARPSPHGRGNGTGCDGPAVPLHHGRRPIGAAVPGL
jgi:hypothetical protein